MFNTNDKYVRIKKFKELKKISKTKMLSTLEHSRKLKLKEEKKNFS